ncbi:MAG: hypothetical protein AAFY51_01190 [Pseudomonadota bacterium]
MLIRTLFITAPLAMLLQAAPAVSSETTSQASATPIEDFSAEDAFISLAGKWSGELQYRDYQSDELESITVAVTMEALPDGETIIQRYDYSDPGFQVYITSLITVKDDVLAGATARAGRAFETYEKAIAVTRQASPTDWGIVLTDESNDDNRPARIRETMTRHQSVLTVLKEVDYLDDDKEEWEFRNQITLTAQR